MKKSVIMGIAAVLVGLFSIGQVANADREIENFTELPVLARELL